MESVFVIVTGTCWFRVPESIRINFVGTLADAVLGKDVVLDLARRHGTDFALYQSIEYGGPGLHSMALHDRWTLSNMGIELGAKFAICEPDEVIYDFLVGRTDRPYTPVLPDADATYSYIEQVDLSKLEPLVALPGDPSNGIPVTEVVPGTKVDQVFIGSCAEGRFENFEMAARVLKGRKVHPDVRLIASPGSQAVWQECLRAGLWEIFTEAGALVMHSTCGPCQGGHLGVLASKEVCVSTGPRNFAGRMGHPEALIYEANAAVAAAAAVAGEIVDPRDFL
jgi:3-isopropylmalate/(R)-2-methylmalate dehydratase large subunit